MTQIADPQAERLLTESRERPVSRKRPRQYLASLSRHGILIAASLVFLLPFYWMLSTAVKDNGQVFAQPLNWWPNPIHLDNFWKAINDPGFPYFSMLWNSIIYAAGVTIGTVFSCATTAYGLARLRFPGRNLLFIVTVATLMIPSFVTFIPTYVLFKTIGLIGSYAPLILPAFLGNAFYIFMLRQFFMGIPWELSEAAKMDGASEYRIFWQIMLPLVKPALLVVAVFSILYTWQDFFGPLVYLSDASQYPLSLGLFAFKAQRSTDWVLMMAGSTLVTLPLILIFVFLQRYFLEGITMTGLKG